MLLFFSVSDQNYSFFHIHRYLQGCALLIIRRVLRVYDEGLLSLIYSHDDIRNMAHHGFTKQSFYDLVRTTTIARVRQINKWIRIILVCSCGDLTPEEINYIIQVLN